MFTSNSKKQTQLYNYKNEFDYFVDMFSNNKLPNKILINGKKGIGKCTFAYHFINYIFSKNENNSYDKNNLKINENNKSYILLNSSIHPNIFIINLEEKKKFIDIDASREIIKFNNKSSLINNNKIILINDSEFLNLNSANALLKVIEEPNDNTIIMLIQNSSKNILDTLKSRFITFNFKLNFDQVLNTTNKLLNINIEDYISNEYLYYYLTPGFLIKLYNFSKEEKINLKETSFNELLSIIIEKSLFKKNNFLVNNFNLLIELYFNKLIKINNNKEYIYNGYNEVLKNINMANKYNLDKENVYNEFRAKFLNA